MKVTSQDRFHPYMVPLGTIMVTIGTMSRSPRSESRSVPIARLWASVFTGYLALGATLQLLPTWVTGHLHASAVAAGAAVGLTFVATAAMRPVAGVGAGRGHPQRFVLLGGVLVAVG